jgi:hypothetical protein
MSERMDPANSLLEHKGGAMMLMSREDTLPAEKIMGTLTSTNTRYLEKPAETNFANSSTRITRRSQ